MLGVIVLVSGLLFKISVLWAAGLVVLAIGVVLIVMAALGHRVGGHRYH